MARQLIKEQMNGELKKVAEFQGSACVMARYTNQGTSYKLTDKWICMAIQASGNFSDVTGMELADFEKLIGIEVEMAKAMNIDFMTGKGYNIYYFNYNRDKVSTKFNNMGQNICVYTDDNGSICIEFPVDNSLHNTDSIMYLETNDIYRLDARCTYGSSIGFSASETPIILDSTLLNMSRINFVSYINRCSSYVKNLRDYKNIGEYTFIDGNIVTHEDGTLDIDMIDNADQIIQQTSPIRVKQFVLPIGTVESKEMAGFIGHDKVLSMTSTCDGERVITTVIVTANPGMGMPDYGFQQGPVLQKFGL